jgi:hypothetical protein
VFSVSSHQLEEEGLADGISYWISLNKQRVGGLGISLHGGYRGGWIDITSSLGGVAKEDICVRIAM